MTALFTIIIILCSAVIILYNYSHVLFFGYSFFKFISLLVDFLSELYINGEDSFTWAEIEDTKFRACAVMKVNGHLKMEELVRKTLGNIFTLKILQLF